MNPALPRPPELHGILPPALADAVDKAQRVADARLSYLLEPGCLRDTFHHDMRALYTLVRINKTLTDYCLRHPEPPADDPSAPGHPGPVSDPSADASGQSGRHGESGPSAPSSATELSGPSTGSITSTGSTSSASPESVQSVKSVGVPSSSSSDPPTYPSHSKPQAETRRLVRRSRGEGGSLGEGGPSWSSPSRSAPFVKSVEDRLASPDPASPTNLLSPLLVRLLDRAESDLGHHMETHMLSRGLERPALFPADVERVAALVSVRVTLAEVAARAPNLPDGALNAWLALALDAGVLGKLPRDPDVRSPELEEFFKKERLQLVAENEKAWRDRQAAKLVDEFLTDVHADDPSDLQLSGNRDRLGVAFGEAGSAAADLRDRPADHDGSPSSTYPSYRSHTSHTPGGSEPSDLEDSPVASAEPVDPDAARAAVDALLESANKSFDNLHRRAPRLAREPHVPSFFCRVPESAFALNVDRAEPLTAAPAPDPKLSPAPESSLADDFLLVKSPGVPSSPNHSAERSAHAPATHPSHRSHASHTASDPPADPSAYPSYPSHSSYTSSAAPPTSTPPKSVRVAPPLSSFPKDLKRHVFSAPVDAADLTSRAAFAAGNWIFTTVTDALFLLLRRIQRSIGHPARPPSPFYRPYLPQPWKPLPP